MLTLIDYYGMDKQVTVVFRDAIAHAYRSFNDGLAQTPFNFKEVWVGINIPHLMIM